MMLKKHFITHYFCSNCGSNVFAAWPRRISQKASQSTCADVPREPATVVILDNLSTHKDTAAAQTMREAGNWFLFRCSGKTSR